MRDRGFVQHLSPVFKQIIDETPARMILSSNIRWTDLTTSLFELYPFRGGSGSPGENIVVIHVEQISQVTASFEGHREQVTSIPGGITLTPAKVHFSFASTTTVLIQHIYFGQSLIDKAIAELNECDPDLIRLRPQFNIRDPFIEQLGSLLLAEARSDDPIGRMYAEALGNTLALHLLRHYSTLTRMQTPRPGSLSAIQLHRVLDYLNDQLDQNISLPELAAVASLSPSQFTRRFKQSTGLAPHQYLIKLRVERAKALLGVGNLSVAAVARQVGFSDQSHLVRHFKRVYGINPSRLLADSRNIQKHSSNIQADKPETP